MRPRAVNFKTINDYNLLHTRKVKMYSGVSVTALQRVKQIGQWFYSSACWASMCSAFKKKNLELNFELPIITDEKSLAFLDEYAWHDWVDKRRKDQDSEMIEAIAFLLEIFPDKNPVYFYELGSLVNTYCYGTFVSYDKNGNKKEASEYNLESRAYYCDQYFKPKKGDFPHLDVLRERWTAEKNKEKSDLYLTEYGNARRENALKHSNLVDVFIDVCSNAVVYPVAFSKPTLFSYKHAGEIIFVQTNDKIYFEVLRHY